MSTLDVRPDQDFWDADQAAVLRSAGIDDDVTEPELRAFLHECQRRQLDPFSRQIYLIGRWDRRAGRKVYRSQTSIDGFRVIARRAADRAGINYSYEDTIWYDQNGSRFDVWLSPGVPAAAKVVVVRDGARFDAVARTDAYMPTGKDGEPMGLWRSMPDVMVAKCAESLALRKAFPEDLSGLYTAEEMAQSDHQATQSQSRKALPPRTPDNPDTLPAVVAALTEAVDAAGDLSTLEAAYRRMLDSKGEGRITTDETRALLLRIKERKAELLAAQATTEPEQADAPAQIDGDAPEDVPEGVGVDPATWDQPETPIIGNVPAATGTVELLDSGEPDTVPAKEHGSARRKDLIAEYTELGFDLETEAHTWYGRHPNQVTTTKLEILLDGLKKGRVQ